MELLTIILSLVLIAFFSGVEIAFVSANKLRIELLKGKGSVRAKFISAYNNNPSKFISTMLVGLNISLVIFASVTARYFVNDNFSFLPTDNQEFSLLIVQTLFTTVVILLFGELIPKILFRVNADQSLLLFSYPIQFFYLLLSPFNFIFHNLARWIIKVIDGKELTEAQLSFTKADLEYLVKETAYSDEEGDDETDHLNSELFEKALYLKDIKIRACMVPRPEIQALDVSEDVATLKAKFIETKLSRIIIYDESIDQIKGYIHHFDLLKNPSALRSVIRPLQVIPGSMTARDLLLQFIRERKNIAWVVDEYGGTAGIITLEDLMEEIFGEIEDEHDTPNLTEKIIAEKEFVFSGRLEVDYLNEKYDLDIPEGDYTTLSGYVISGIEDIPAPGTLLELDHFLFKILRATDTRIELVNVKIKSEQ